MVYSRSNEDEVIETLINKLGEGNKVCVDIGAKSIQYSNVANLIVNKGWTGVLIDRGIKNYHNLFQEFMPLPICLMYATVNPKNVNDLMPQQFQVLSIDIDGQDYHVWKAMTARPPIVCIEYNKRMSGHRVMKRDDKYEWKLQKDYDNAGASKDALVELGESKGYSLFDLNDDNLFFTLTR